MDVGNELRNLNYNFFSSYIISNTGYGIENPSPHVSKISLNRGHE